MNKKYIIGGTIIIVFFAILLIAFTETDIKYENDFAKIKSTNKTFRATGVWIKERSFEEDRNKRIFSFYMKDANNIDIKVLYKGFKPNNFEIATTMVVTGKFQDGVFHASDILTKCPSKYEKQISNS